MHQDGPKTPRNGPGRAPRGPTGYQGMVEGRGFRPSILKVIHAHGHIILCSIAEAQVTCTISDVSHLLSPEINDLSTSFGDPSRLEVAIFELSL